MKKFFVAAFTAVVAVMMLAGCTKGANSTASIVGTWESYSATTVYLDANGNPMSLKDVAIAMMKATGLVSDEIIEQMDDAINQRVKELEKTQTQVFDDKYKSRVEFTSDGTMKGYEKDGAEWKEAGSGTYKYEGNKLTMTATDLDEMFSGTATVVKLDATNLVMRVKMSDMVEEVKAAEESSDLGFDILMDLTLVRVK